MSKEEALKMLEGIKKEVESLAIDEESTSLVLDVKHIIMKQMNEVIEKGAI